MKHPCATIGLLFCLLSGLAACSVSPAEDPLDPTTAQGLFLSLYRPAAEQLPVSGAGFWIRADDAVNQSGLTIWLDRSGSGSTIAGPQIPIDASRVNGRPAVSLPGSTPYHLDGLANPSSPIPSPCSLFSEMVQPHRHL